MSGGCNSNGSEPDDSLLLALVQALRPVEMTEEERQSLRQRIVERIRDSAPEHTLTTRAAEGAWGWVGERVRIKVLRDDEERGERTFLIEFLPGARYAARGHEREEVCFVLEGEVCIGPHCLRRGDLHVAAAGSWHSELTAPQGCLCLVRSAIPCLKEAT